MGKWQQTGQVRRSLGGLLIVGLAALTGCSQTPMAAAPKHDPLHGVLTPPDLPQPSGAPKTPGTTTSMPSNNRSAAPTGSELSSTNNATLAGLSGSTLGRPLAIDDQGRALPPGAPRTLQTPVQPQYPGYNPKPKVEAVPDIQPASNPFMPSSWQPDAIKVGTPKADPSANEQMTRQLQARGVVNQKIDQLSGGIHLTCYVSRGDASSLRVLEVTAIDYPTAARAILQQLESGR